MSLLLYLYGHMYLYKCIFVNKSLRFSWRYNSKYSVNVCHKPQEGATGKRTSFFLHFVHECYLSEVPLCNILVVHNRIYFAP